MILFFLFSFMGIIVISLILGKGGSTFKNTKNDYPEPPEVYDDTKPSKTKITRCGDCQYLSADNWDERHPSEGGTGAWAISCAHPEAPDDLYWTNQENPNFDFDNEQPPECPILVEKNNTDRENDSSKLDIHHMKSVCFLDINIEKYENKKLFKEPPRTIDFTLCEPKIEYQGLMKSFIGPLLDSKKIEERQNDPEYTGNYKYLRAFTVIPLWGAEFSIEKDSEIGTSLRNLLNQKLSPIKFEEVEGRPTVLRKYFFINTSNAAPKDEATGQPMAIEIYADLKEFKANEDSGVYEKKLTDLYKQAKKRNEHLCCLNADYLFSLSDDLRYKIFGSKDESYVILKHEVVAHMEFQITEAVYSNILYPNISGSFYE